MKLISFGLCFFTMNAAVEAALSIELEQGGASTRGAGVALYRERANLVAGKEFSFVGEYKDGFIRMMDPPWVMVTHERRLHWRIYFFMDTGEGFERAVSGYLDPEQVKRVEPLPAVRRYVEGMKRGGRHGRFTEPELSLRAVYGDTLPEAFAKLDPVKTKVGLYCDNLGQPAADLQQCFGMKPDKEHAAGVARFTGVVFLNRPDFHYHQREEQKLHHFNLKLAHAKPIKMNLTYPEAKRRFADELAEAGPRLAKLCEANGLKYAPAPNDSAKVSWVDGNLAVSGLITPRPDFSIKPVPYATATVCFDPEAAKRRRLLFVKRIHQDPKD